jgi:hypothetical protein
MAWPGAVDTTNLEKVGIYADAVCATNGAGTDLNALHAAGAKKIILGPGAVLTANLSLTGNDGWLWSPYNPLALDLGAYKLAVVGHRWHLEGFSVDGSASVGVAVEGSSILCTIRRVGALNCTSHGIQLNTTSDYHRVEECYIESNGGDGIWINATVANAKIFGNHSRLNTGYGVNDLSNSCLLGLNQIDGNTAGALNGTPDQDVGNKKT